MSKVLELFGVSTLAAGTKWKHFVATQGCPYLKRQCTKTRKSEPEVSIGTCSVSHGKKLMPVVICPIRLLERNQVFTDCLQLLTTHEAGNELHILPEVPIPGGSVDYFLASVRNLKVRDFVGVEFQTLDTTGTAWPERQRFLKKVGLSVRRSDAESEKKFGMNWKMTAKTTLVQLHHKIKTFEHINKHLVLVVQDCLLDYMRREFKFAHLTQARVGDPMQIHSYKLATQKESSYRLELESRWSTDSNGIALCLGLQAEAHVELEQIIEILEAKISDETVFRLQ
jgi:hypothetical protein